MSDLQEKVALVTGAAHGQGQAHAVRLAADGADIIAVDICDPHGADVAYELSSAVDLDETARLVTDTGRQIRCFHADVRDAAAMRALVAEALADFGHIDIVIANAGILSVAAPWEITDEQWDEMIAVNLTGVRNTVQPTLKPMIDAGRGGAIVLTSSTSGAKGLPGLAHYTAAKHGVIGYMRALAVDLAAHRIRVNAVLPAAVSTAMVHNEATYRLFRPDLEAPTRADFEQAVVQNNLLPIALVEPEDVAAAVAHLVSDDARAITGMSYPVDLGALTK